MTVCCPGSNIRCHGSKPTSITRRRATITPEPYYTVETYSAEDSIGFLIAATRTRVFRAINVELGRFGFTAAQWPILRAVADGETPIAADLCRQLNYDTGSMTRMLNRLESKGVIAREADVQDRRIIRIRVTAAGRRLFPRLRDGVIRVLNHLVAGLLPRRFTHCTTSCAARS